MAVFIIVNLVLSLVFKYHYAVAQDVESVILHGDDAKIEEYPFYAGLNNCGAAILSHIWILTAAHCVEDVNPSQRNYVFVGGEAFANSVRVPYGRIHIHPGYHNLKGIPVNDIALLQLTHPLQFSKKIRPVKLPFGLSSNKNLSFVGRGIDETGTISKNIKSVDLIRLNTQQCISLIPPEFSEYIIFYKILESTHICLNREGDRPSICQGDSGSPLVSANTVVGLASFIGNLGCDKVRLGFFVNVETFVPWIKSITGL